MAEPSTSSNHTGQTAPEDDVHLLSDKSSPGSTPSPTLPARSSPPHLRLDGSEIFDTDDFHPALPSPPYKTFASVTNLNAAAESYAQQTPPYRSRADLMDTTHDDHARSDPDRKTRVDDDDDDEQNDVETKGVKPTVHYPADLPTGPTPVYNTIPPGIEHGDLYKLHSRVESIAGTEDEEDESEDYDWSNEEDLVDEEAKFEAQMGLGKQTKGWSLRRILSLLFGSLIGSVVLAGVLVAGPILAFFFWYKPHPDAHRRYVMDNIMAWLFWAAANVLLSWWLAMFIDVAPVIIRGAVSLVWGHVSERTKTHIEMYNSVKGTIKPLFYAASAWVSWIILFESIFKLHDRDDATLSRAPYTEKLSDVVEFLFFLILVWCAQKMLSHAIAFQFHRIAFKERIDDLRMCLTVIERLRTWRPKRERRHGRSRTPVFPLSDGDASRRASWRATTETPSESEWDGDVEDSSKGKGKKKAKGKKAFMKGRRASAIPSALSSAAGTPSGSPRAMSPAPSDSPHRYPPTSSPQHTHQHSHDDDESEMVVVQAAKVLKNAVLHDARNIEGKAEDTRGLVWDVANAHEAKRLARAIYTTFRSRHRRYLLPSDFEPAYATPEEAQRAFRVFDGDNNGDISRAEIKTKLLKVYRERRFLSRSMRDVGLALHTLDRILLFFAAAILFFVSLSVFNVNVEQSLTSVYSIGIAASFIFKNAASNAFDAIMFLFVTHPYDTGDRCFIDEENLVVKKMGLFATVFTRADGTETYYFNSQLFNKFITNVRRSDKTTEVLTMQVAWKTPLEKLDALEKCINDWLSRDENRWFVSGTSITPQHIICQRHLELTIGIPHNGNWQDWGLRNARRTAFHAAVQYYCRQLGIVANEAPLPVVWADNSTLTFSPSLDTVDAAPPPSPLPVPAGTTGAAQKRNWLGFVPTENSAASDMRARKSQSKKAAMRGLGADG